jgi:RNA polymerase sigma-70 factor (ECF subfamily)
VDSSVTSLTLLHRLRSDEQDQEAWQQFVDRYGARIYDWCLNRKLETADAQDVTQEILLRLASQMRTFEYDPKKSFRGWLRRVTENAIIDFFRSNKLDRGKGGSSLISLKNEPARVDLAAHLGEVFDLEMMDEAKSRVQKRVTEKRWLSWHLLTHTNLSGKEVAEKLGVSVGVAYANKSQIQKMIQAEIEAMDSVGE